MTLLLIVSALSTLLLLLLAAPLDISFQIERVEGLDGHISVRWLFGVVRFRFPVSSAPKHDPEVETRKVPKKRRATRKTRRARPNFVAVLRQSEFRQRAYRFVKDLIYAIHLQRLQLLIRLGLGDPADTGRLWAMVGPLSATAQNLLSADVHIEPEFMDSVFEVRADGQLRLIPLQFIALAIAFVLSPPSLRAWRTLRGSRA